MKRLKLGCPGILGWQVARTGWSRPRLQRRSNAILANLVQVVYRARGTFRLSVWKFRIVLELIEPRADLTLMRP